MPREITLREIFTSFLVGAIPQGKHFWEQIVSFNPCHAEPGYILPLQTN